MTLLRGCGQGPSSVHGSPRRERATVAQERTSQRQQRRLFRCKQLSGRPPKKNPRSAPIPVPFQVHYSPGPRGLAERDAADFARTMFGGRRSGSHETYCVLAALCCTSMAMVMAMTTKPVARTCNNVFNLY